MMNNESIETSEAEALPYVAPVAAAPAPAAAPLDHCANTSRISWMAAQGDLTINTFELVFGQGTIVEIIDGDDDVIGTGRTLEEALDDAMGVKHG